MNNINEILVALEKLPPKSISGTLSAKIEDGVIGKLRNFEASEFFGGIDGSVLYIKGQQVGDYGRLDFFVFMISSAPASTRFPLRA